MLALFGIDVSTMGSSMLRDAWHDFEIALTFLTRLAVRSGRASAPAVLAASAPMFPLVGALVGLVGGSFYGAAAWLGLPPPLAAIFALAAMTWLTGALHEDGLADVADGFGGGRSRQNKLDIMRDSRLGSFGAIVMILSLLTRIGALATLSSPAAVAAALVAAGAVSRALLPAAMVTWPPARDDGLAAAAGRPHPARAAVAGIVAALLAFLLLPPMAAAIALLMAVVAGGVMGLLAQRQIGGLTGDVLGAIQQIAEIGFLLVLIAR